ncbi:MAG: hypothetical protein D3920_04295 [Candidatus Electrothrix sp. AW2]|nr:hypothetical protein [Candidatus Electrothrix gigas]
MYSFVTFWMTGRFIGLRKDAEYFVKFNKLAVAIKLTEKSSSGSMFFSNVLESMDIKSQLLKTC